MTQATWSLLISLSLSLRWSPFSVSFLLISSHTLVEWCVWDFSRRAEGLGTLCPSLLSIAHPCAASSRIFQTDPEAGITKDSKCSPARSMLSSGLYQCLFMLFLLTSMRYVYNTPILVMLSVVYTVIHLDPDTVYTTQEPKGKKPVKIRLCLDSVPLGRLSM